MADTENTAQNLANPIPDVVLEEIQKISQMEKDVGNLYKRTSIMYGDIADLKEARKQKENKIKEDDVSDDGNDDNDETNVISTNKLKPTINSVEKKRYEQIGKEFLKGARNGIIEMRKTQELKAKMATNKIKELKQKEEKKSDGDKKKSKMGFFAKLGIVLTSIGLLYVLFEDKIKKFLPDFSINFPTLSNGVGNIFESFGKIFYNIIGATFGDAFASIITNSLPGIITKFFYYVLPASLERAVLAAMSAFSDSARERYEKGVVSFDANFEKAQQRYDEEMAQRGAREDYVKLSSGAFSGSELIAARNRAFSGAFLEYDSSQGNSNTTDLLAKMVGQAVFGLDTSTGEGLDEVKKYIFNDNHPIARSLISQLMSQDKEIQAAIADGLTEDEIKNIVAPMVAKSAGIATDGTDVRYEGLQRSLLSSLGSDAGEAAKRMSSLLGVVGKYEEVIEGEQISAVRAAQEAKRAETNAALAKVQVNGLAPDAIGVTLTQPAVDSAIGAAVHDFYNKMCEFFKNPDDIVSKYITSISSLTKWLFKHFLGKAFDLLNGIIENIPVFFRQSGLDRTVGRIGDIINSDVFTASKEGNYKVNEIQAAIGSAGAAPAVIMVNLSLNGSFTDEIVQMGKNRKATLEKLEDTNKQLESIVSIVNDKNRIAQGVDLNALSEKLTTITSETNSIFQKQFNIIDSRVAHIETYLEENDKDDTSNGQLPPFALQTQSS